MKIGIITMTPRTNSGGILQAYALQHVLEGMGHQVYIIRKSWESSWPKMLVIYVKRILLIYIFRRSDIRIFEERMKREQEQGLMIYKQRFIDRYLQILPVYRFTYLNRKGFDAYVVGSDQVWRRVFVDFQKAFLGFTEGQDVKRISYAASFGIDSWDYTEEETARIQNEIAKFDAVSVREDSGVRLCKDYLKVEAKHVLDPTMLLDKSDYMKLVDAVTTESHRGELIAYILDREPLIDCFIEEVAAQKGLTVFYAESFMHCDIPGKEHVCSSPPIERWLKGFNDASFIITDSFHATVFSILFEKPFINLGNKNRGMARFNSLLKMFGLENHLILDIKDYDSNNDYSIAPAVYTQLNAWRKESLEFLKESLIK